MDHKAVILEAARLNARNLEDKRASEQENRKNATGLVDTKKSPTKTSLRHDVKLEGRKPQSSRTPERSKRFPSVTDKPLVILRPSAPTFDRFSFSPLSPKAFPRFNSTEWDTLPGRSSLLERYLETQEGHSPILRQSSEPLPHIRCPTADRIASARISGARTNAVVGDVVSTAPLPQEGLVCPTNNQTRRPEERVKNRSFTSSSQNRSNTSSSKTHAGSSSARTRYSNTSDAWTSTSASNSRSHIRRIGKPRSSSQSRVVSARSWDDRVSNETSDHPSTSLSTLRVDAHTMILPFDQIVLSPSLAKECRIPSPPPAPTTVAFGEEVPRLSICVGNSPFDPPPAPVHESFPLMFPASPSFSGPAPIDTTLSVIESPLLPDERFKAIEGGRFQTVDTPINPPLAPIRDKFPLQFPPSPRRAGPCPIDTSAVYVSSPSSAWGNASPSGSITPTQPPSTRIEELIPAPLLAANKSVRFADLTLSTQSRTSDGQSPPVFSPVTPIAMIHTFPLIAPTSPLMSEYAQIFEDTTPLDHHSQHQGQDGTDGSNKTFEAQDLRLVARGREAERISNHKPRARTLSPPRTAISLEHDPWATLSTTADDSNAGVVV